jgi:glycosyltransferase involved in cell wall biosynthesis
VPFISIIIPVFNIEPIADFFMTCVRSVCEQTYTDIEIIIIDDGSTDATGALMAPWASQDKRVRLLRHDSNLGVAAARNTGSRVSSGEYLWYVDGDDVLPAGACATLSAMMVAHKMPDLVSVGYAIIDSSNILSPRGAAKSKPRTLLLDGASVAKMFLQGRLSHAPWSILVQRSLAFKCDFLVQSGNLFTIEDLPHALELFAMSKDALIVSQAFYHHRADTPGSATKSRLLHSKSEQQNMSRVRIYRRLLDDLHMVGKRYRLDVLYPNAYRRFCIKWQLKYMLVALETKGYRGAFHVDKPRYLQRRMCGMFYVIVYLWGRWWRNPLRLVDGVVLTCLFVCAPLLAKKYYDKRKLHRKGIRRL